MWSFNLVRWLRSSLSARKKTIEKKPRFRLSIEELENRLAPAAFIWTGNGADTNWNTNTNWQGGAAPQPATPATDLIFGNSASAGFTSVNNITGLVVNSIQISGGASPFDLSGNRLTLGDPGTPGSGTIQVGSFLTGERIGMDIQLAATSSSQQFFTVGQGADLTLSGKLTGTSGSQLTKEGAGTLILTNDNSGYVGPFNIDHDAGIVRISHAKALGVSTNTVTVGNNSQLQLNSIGAANPIGNTLKLFGAGVNSDGSLVNLAGSNVWSGPIQIGSNTSFNEVTGSTLTITGSISDLGSPFNVTKSGRGELILANANSYRGSTTVADGTLTLAHPQALGSVPAAGTSVVRNTLLDTIGTLKLQFDSTIAPNGPASSQYWTLQDPTQAFDAVNNPYVGFVVNDVPLTLNGAGFVVAGNPQGALWNALGNNTWTGTVTLGSDPPVGANVTVNVDAAANQTRLFLTGVVQDPSPVPAAGPFDLTKIGNGDLVLSPTAGSVGTANTYRGLTTISNGTVTLRDSQGLGPQTKRHISNWATQSYDLQPIVTVASGAGLNLESNVGHIDSVTSTVNRLQVASPVGLNGTGFNGLGALHSISGINTYVEKFFTAPTGLSANDLVAAVGLAPGQTYWVVTALDGYGESLASPEATFLVVAGRQNVTLSWSSVAGATGYKLYRSTTQGTYGANSLVATVNGVNNTSFTDTGTALTAGTPPSTFPIINLPTDAAIGVDADPNQTADNTYFTKDYSLTVTGGIAGGTSSFPTNRLLTKVRAGHLILPNANQQFFGSTTISAGWITIQDPAALGGPNPSVQEVQPTVTVNFDAALMLRPYADGTSFTFTHNMVLQGMGIHHAYSKIDQQGAVENLAGVNTLNSNIQLKGPVGIGVEEVFGRSNLVSTGEISQGQGALNFAGDAGGNRNENIGPGVNNGVNTGSTSGRLVLNAFVHTQPDDIRVYMGNWKLDPANARLIYDASNDFVSVRPTPVNRGGASITIDYTATTATIDVVHVNDPGIPPFGAGAGPGQNWLYAGLGPQAISFAPVSGLYATWITIVVNPGGNSSSQTQWRYTAQITPAGNFGGMIKLGSQRLELEGPGVYMGGVEIRNGVVRVENNTGLGARGNAGTIVQPGTALELANPTPDSNGGQSIGAAIWDTPLSLNGTGNSIFGDSALTVLGKDNLWHGPITLNSSIALSFKGTLANQAINTLTSSAGGVTVVTSTPGGGGVNAVQTLTFAGVASGSTFTLTYDDGVGAPVTTGSITYSTNPSTLITNIINRLNPVLGANNFGIALVSPTININPNSRLLVTGAITDPTNPTTAGTDLIMDGGGSLFLSGTNTYRGTTLVNQGTLTIQNGAALGGPGIAGQQQIALVGAVAGSTQFRLSYAGGTQTSAITYTGTPADAATIQTRLSDAGILPAGGTATVVALNPGNFLVTFGGTLAGTTTLLAVQITSGLGSAGVSSEGGTYIADKAQLQLQGGITVSGEPLLIQGAGNNVASAIQTFTIGSTAVIPTGAFSLDFNGSDTGPLPYNITAGQLQAALQNLSSVKNVAGQVVVNIDTIYAGTNEEQRVLFTGFNVGDTYQLYFDPASGAQQLGYNLTAPITYTGNAFTEKNNIVAALGNLQVLTNIGGTISGIAAAGVSGGVEFADFVFTGALADQDVGSAQVFALTGAGTPTVSEFVKGATGYRTFSVGFQGSFDGQAQPTMTAGASGVSGSTTMTAPVTTLVGGSANATPTQWFAQGPAPIANAVVNGGAQPTGNQLTTGRVTGVDVQQGFAGDIYIATADGGFWRTVDGGTHWTPVFDNINGSVIFGGAVTIAQTANSTVYFGTGEGNNSADSYYGSGVYSASTRADLATTITTKLVNPDGSNPLAGKAINKIVVNPNNPLMIWVAVSDRATNGSTGNAGIWRYDGTNWLNMTPPGAPTTNYSYSDVAIENNGATLRLYAALGNPTAPNSNDVRVTNNPDAPGPTWSAGGVFSAAVGGATGTIKLATVAGGVFGTAYAAVSNPAGNSMDVFRTANGGTSWAKTGANPANFLAGQGNYAISIVARRVGGNDLVFVAGHDAGAGTNFVIRSANGGGAWADRSKDANNVGPHTDVHALALTIDPLTNTPVLVAGTDGGVWRFDDAASTWANLNGNLNITNLNSVASQPGNSGILLAGTQANGTARYDGTSAWSQVDPGVSSATLVRYSASDPNIAYSLFGGIFRRSTTGGSAWIAGAAQSDFAIDLVNSNRVLLGSAGASVRESMNAGASSIPLNSPANGQVAAATYQGPFLADSFFPSVGDVGANTYVPDTIYVANTNNIFLTKNHGVTWTFRTGGITGATNATPIVITSNNHGLQTGQRVIITGVAVNTNANGLFTINVVDANRFELVGSAGNGVGVGGTWTLADRAPPLQPGTTIQDLIVDPSNSNVLYVVAAGRVTAAGTGRVFKSSDSGRTWTDISSGLPLSAHTGLVLPVWTVVHDYRTNDLYAGTDEGVWKLTGGSGNWQRFGAGLPVVQVKDLDLNPSMNVLTAATYGRGAWQFTLDDNTLPNAPTYPGALRSVAGKNTWNGPIVLAGPTTISANGSQALQNGLSAASLNVFGIISDLTTTNANTLTKIGGGDVILSGPNTYAGVTDIQQGNLVVRDPSALGGAAIAGVQAISVQATAAPTLVTSALSASAGTLSAGTTYYYVVTAVGPYGESIASSQTSFTTSAPSQAIDLSWHVVDGATGYYVYRSTTSGSFGERLAPITSGTTTSFTDTGTAGTSNSPPVLQFTISIRNGGNTYTTGPITYTGVPASDAAAIVGVLTPGFFNTAGFSGGTAAVVSLNAGMFRVTFGGTLANQPTPVLIPAVTSPAGSFASVSVTPGGGTIVEPNAALVLESSLYLEPVTVNAHGIPLTYSGHNTGALRSSSNVNTYTGTLTLNTNSTIGVDSGSSLTLANAAPIVITSANHGLATGQTIAISNVQGNTAANGSWTVTVIDASRFSLNGSLGNGNYSSGGTWTATSTGAVTAASNAAPIVVTSNGHGLVNGQKVSITGVLGNTAANNTVGNPTWTVAGASANTFQLVGSTGNGAYTSGGTWTLVASGAITAATNAVSITDNGVGFSLDKESTGTLVLASAGSYGTNTTAGTMVNQGVLNVQNSNALGVAGSTTTVRDGAQLQLQSAANAPINVATENLVLSGSGITGTGAMRNVVGNNSWGSPTTTVTLTSVPGFSPTTRPAGAVAFSVANLGDTLTIGSPVVEPAALSATPTSGPLSMGLVKLGPGRLTLTQSDSYSGTTYVNAGILSVQNAGALGANDGDDVQRITVFSTLPTDQFTLTFNGQTTGLLTYGVPPFGGATPTASVQNALNALSSINGGGGSVSVTQSNISFTTPTGVTTGIVYTVTFGGTLAKKAQPLISATPAGGTSIAVSRVADGGVGTRVSTGASLELDGDPLHNNSSISLPATQRLWLNGAGSAALYGITAASQVVGGTTVTATVVSTAGLFTGETVTIAGFTPSGYNGTFTITVVDATRFRYEAPAGLAAVTVLGSATASPGALRNVSGNNTWTGPVFLQTSSSIGADPTTRFSVTGTIQDPPTSVANPIPSPAPAADLTKVGTGTLVFPNANTYAGNTLVNSGVLNIQHNTALGGTTSAIQTINVLGTSGQYHLTYNGVNTIDLSIGASAAQVKAALDTAIQTATGNAANNVTVTQNGNVYTVYFNGGALAMTAQPMLTATLGAGVTVVDITAVQLGAESSTVVATGATLQMEGGITESSGKSIILNGPGFGGAGALDSVAGNNTASTLPLLLGSTSAIGADGSSRLTIDQLITDQFQTQSIQFSTLFPSNGAYTLSFDGATTPTLNFNSGSTTAARTANAKAIEDALNALPTIALRGGVVSVAVPSSGRTYVATFGGRMIGTNWPTIIRTSSSTITITRTMNAGNFGVNKVGLSTVQYAGATANSYSGLTDVHSGVLELAKTGGALALTNNLQIGDTTPVSQVQALDLSGLAYGDVFTLSYNSSPASAPLTYYTNPAYEAAQIQAALNALPTIGGLATPGSVTVVPNGANKFLITFGGSLAGVRAFTPVQAVKGATTIDATLQTAGAVPVLDFAQVLYLGNNQIATSSDVLINNDGLWNLGGFAQTLSPTGSLTMIGGDVQLPTTSNLTIGSGAGAATLTATSDTVRSSRIQGAGRVTLGGTAANFFDIGDGPQDSDLIFSAGLQDSGQGFNKINTGRLEVNALEGATLTGRTRIDAGDVQVDGMGSTQIITLTNAVANTTTLAVTLNGVSSPSFTYTGVAATDGPALKAAIVALGVPSANVTVTPDVTDTIFTIVFTTLMPAVIPAITSTQVPATGNAYLTLPNNLSAVLLNGGSLSGTGAVSAISMNGAAAGTVTPGVNPVAPKTSKLHVNGNVSWTSNTTFYVDLTNASGTHPIPIAGNDYDQLDVVGNSSQFNLNNALLDGMTSPGIQIGDQFTIIQASGGITPGSRLRGNVNGSTGVIVDHVFLNGQKFDVTYTPNSVILTRVFASFSAFTIVADHNPSVYGQQVTYTVSAVPEPGSSLATANPVINFNVDGGLYTDSVALAPVSGNITGATNAGPIVITSTAHGRSSGESVRITGVGGNTNANGSFIITVIDADRFSLNGSTGNAAYTSGGTWSTNVATLTPQQRFNLVWAPVRGDITNASGNGVSPIVITSNGHGLQPGQSVTIAGVTGNTNANGSYPVTIIDANSFSLNGPTGNGAYAGGGTWTLNETHIVNANFVDSNGVFQPDNPKIPPTFTTPTPMTQKVDQNTVTLGLQQTSPASGDPFYGQTVTITATVSPFTALNVTGAVRPTGTVTFVLDPTPGPGQTTQSFVRPILVPATGVATLDLTPAILSSLMGIGTHTVRAYYNGDPNYASNLATPTTFSFNVQADVPSVTITPSPATGTLGQLETFFVKVVPTVPGSLGIITGTINLYDNSTALPPLNSTPIAFNGAIGDTVQFSTSALSVSPPAHNIIAVFTRAPANLNYTNGQGNTSFTVNKAPTDVTFTQIQPSSPAFGQPVTFTVKVVPNPVMLTNFGPITGAVTLWDGPAGTGTLLNSGSISVGTGQATIVVPGGALSRGTHATITARYNGDSQFLQQDGVTSLTIAGASTTITQLTASPTGKAPYGTAVTFQATVVGSNGLTPPTGVGLQSRVDFVDSVTGTVYSAPLQAGGIASVILNNATNIISGGLHNITATYFDTTPAANFAQSPPRTLSNYAITNAPTAIQVLPATWSNSPTTPTYGQTVTLHARVTGNPLLAGPVTFGVAGSKVTFWDGPVGTGVNLGTGIVVDNAGNASLDVSNLSAVTHTINASYADTTGNNFFRPSSTTSGASLTIDKASTATTLVSSFAPSNTSAAGQPVTYTATVNLTGQSIGRANAGTITFLDNGSPMTVLPVAVGTSGANTGIATVTVTYNAAQIGDHLIEATYNPPTTGTVNFLASVPPTVSITQKVLRASAITVTSPNPVTAKPFGPNLTYTITVTSPQGNPLPPTNPGHVTVTENGVAVPGATGGVLANNGFGVPTTTITIPGGVLSQGTHNLLFTYIDDTAPTAQYANKSTNPIAQVINSAGTQVSLTSPPTLAVFGQPITVNGTITTTVAGGINPTTGTVKLFLDSTANAPLATQNLGSSAFSFTNVSIPATYNIGAHTMIVTFTPTNTNYLASSKSQSLPIKGSTSTTIVSSSTPTGPNAYASKYGQSVTFTAVVTAAAGGMPTTTGATMQFYNGAALLGNGSLLSTTATTATYRFTTSTLAVNPGGHSITAVYSGAANFTSSTSGAITQAVDKATVGVTMTSSPAFWASDVNTTFNIVVRLTGGSAQIAPGASVTLYDNGSPLPGTATLLSTTATTATYRYTTTTPLAAGSHQIFARYSGNGNVATNDSIPETQSNVQQFTSLVVTTSANPQPKVRVVYTIKLTGKNGVPISGPVTVVINGQSIPLTTSSNGTATLSYTFATAGTYIVTFDYAGSSSLNLNPAKTKVTTVVASTGRLV